MATSYEKLQAYVEFLKRELEAKKLVVKALGDGKRCKTNGKKYNQILDAQAEVWALEHKAMLAQFEANACLKGGL